MTLAPPLPDRIAQRLNVGDCWEWTGCLNSRGYGSVNIDYRRMYVHRFVYELLVGPIPDGLHIDHLCRNKVCCNPDHLEPVTPAENLRRGHRWHRITYCKHGHLLDGNIYINTKGARVCRTCLRIRGRVAKKRQRQTAKESA